MSVRPDVLTPEQAHALREFAQFVVTLDDPAAISLRQSITLNEIVNRAREALAGGATAAEPRRELCRSCGMFAPNCVCGEKDWETVEVGGRVPAPEPGPTRTTLASWLLTAAGDIDGLLEAYTGRWADTFKSRAEFYRSIARAVECVPEEPT